VRSALWLPLAFQNRLTGLALVYQPGELRTFHREELRLAAAVANQAAIAIRVSQAYEHERNVAETLQRSFMPSVGARLQNFDLSPTYHPALKEAQVGGDFYDVFLLPDGRVVLLMADVSGKGLPAAIQTAMVKYMLRAYASEDPVPASVLRRLNQGVCTFIEPDLFVSAFYGVLCPDTGLLQYGNAGHDSPILALKEHGYCTSLDTTGPVLGLDTSVAYFDRTLSLGPGDVLLLYTDGITDARQGGELFGRERLEELLASLAGSKPSRIVSQIYRTVRAFAEGNLHDDCALLAVKAKEVWRHPAQP
jgi:serine phosphatase RsbU (regulator of sigma subunit)